MATILSWFRGVPQEPKYHFLSDDTGRDSQNLEQRPAQATSVGDETYTALLNWEKKYPSNYTESGGILKIHSYASKILTELKTGSTLSRSNVSEIAAHLRDLAATNEQQTGHNYMFNYFFDNLLRILGIEHKDIASVIRCAMLEIGNRKA